MPPGYELAGPDGYARDTTNPDALKYLPEVRRLLFAGKNAEATAIEYGEDHVTGAARDAHRG